MIVNSTVTAPTGNIQHASEGDQSLFSVNDAYSADERLSAQETDEESDGTTPTPNLDDVFRTSYSKFQDELKWKLPSGDTVEDILYKAYDQKSRASVRNSIRNWVVDLGNKEMQALLSATDWEAIKAEVPPLPPVDAQFAQSLVRFSKVTTTAALRQVLETTSYKDRSVEYDEAQHFDAEWVENVIRQFLTLYEHDTLHGQYRERWYDFHVWSIMDRSFLSLPGVTLDRCELTSQSYVLRKNSDRTEISSRMKSGPRLDGILRNNEDDSHEFCAIEGAPTLRGGTISTKWLSDNAKLRKVLRDMMSRLAIVADHERRVVEQLQVFGISTAGLTMQVSRMSHRKGYVCLLVVDGLYHIPKDIQQFKQLLLFLVAFVRVKRAIAESITAFKNRLQGSSTDDEAFLQEIMNAGDANTTNVAKLPRPADSP